MVRTFQAASRLAALLLVVSASSAFGALYTFDFSSVSLTSNTTLIVSATEDVNVKVTLSTLTGMVGIDGSGAGVIATAGNATDIQQNERLIVTPQLIGPFTLSTVTFGNVDTGGGNSGDESIVYIDGANAGTFTLPTSGVILGAGSVPGSDTFTTSIAFGASDGNDDFRLTQIVIDGIANNAAVPEPASWSLLGLGVAALAWFRRKRS